MKQQILVIEPEQLSLQALSKALSQAGYTVNAVRTASEGLQHAYETHPHLILLDLMLPDMDGWQLCTRFREMSRVPIIVLTALRDEEDLVKALQLGADDYLIKPVTMNVLRAKVKAVLRRAARWDGQDTDPSSNRLEYQGLTLDLTKYEVTLNNRRVDLSPTEFKLLSLLMTHKSATLPSDFLLTQIWGPNYIGEVSHVRLYISYLRKKLESNPAQPQFIHNVWGIGYRFG